MNTNTIAGPPVTPSFVAPLAPQPTVQQVAKNSHGDTIVVKGASIPAPSKQAAFKALSGVAGPAAVLTQGHSANIAAASLTGLGTGTHLSGPNAVAHAYNELHDFTFDPSVAALKLGDATYLPVSKAGVKAIGDDKMVLGQGLPAVSLWDALKSASELSGGDAPAIAIVKDAGTVLTAKGDLVAKPTSYWLHTVTKEGTHSTRLGPQPYSNPLKLTADSAWFVQGDLGLVPSGVVAIVDGSYVAGFSEPKSSSAIAGDHLGQESAPVE